MGGAGRPEATAHLSDWGGWGEVGGDVGGGGWGEVGGRLGGGWREGGWGEVGGGGGRGVEGVRV